MTTDVLIFWSAAIVYGLSALSFVASLIIKREKLMLVGVASACLGFLLNGSAIALRWIMAGAPPFLDISESIAAAVCVGILIFLVAQFVNRRIRLAGIMVMPVSFILLSWAGTLLVALKPDSALSPAMQSYWLWVHIIAASLGFGAVLIAAGMGLLLLLKEKYSGGFYEKVASPDTLDDASYRSISVGFVMLGIMIVAGAFWSNQVHGTFWAWDPVEVWSLIAWLMYGIYLHLRITLGWRGKRLAWYAMLAFPVMIVSLWGIPFVVDTFHSGFRIEH